MTPLRIDMLLHYHCYGTDYPDLSSRSQQDALAYFLNAGFLTRAELYQTMTPNTMKYVPTEKLHVYCEALCRVPEPRQIWVVDSVQPLHTESK